MTITCPRCKRSPAIVTTQYGGRIGICSWGECGYRFSLDSGPWVETTYTDSGVSQFPEHEQKEPQSCQTTR